MTTTPDLSYWRAHTEIYPCKIHICKMCVGMCVCACVCVCACLTCVRTGIPVSWWGFGWGVCGWDQGHMVHTGGHRSPPSPGWSAAWSPPLSPSPDAHYTRTRARAHAHAQAHTHTHTSASPPIFQFAAFLNTFNLCVHAVMCVWLMKAQGHNKLFPSVLTGNCHTKLLSHKIVHLNRNIVEKTVSATNEKITPLVRFCVLHWFDSEKWYWMVRLFSGNGIDVVDTIITKWDIRK